MKYTDKEIKFALDLHAKYYDKIPSERPPYSYHKPLSKKQKHSRHKNKLAKQARKQNR